MNWTDLRWTDLRDGLEWTPVLRQRKWGQFVRLSHFPLLSLVLLSLVEDASVVQRCCNARDLQQGYKAQNNLGSSYLMRGTTGRHSLRGGTMIQEHVGTHERATNDLVAPGTS